jgi:hypothetical protein
VTSDLVEAVTRLAAYAPPVHGSRPWRFEEDAHTLDVRAAAGWSEVPGDVLDRELHVAVGVAVELAQLAVRDRGYSCVVRLAPSCAGGPDHLIASLTLSHEFPTTPFERRLIVAATRPRRRAGQARGGIRDAIALAAGAAAERGCWLRVLSRPRDRAVAADLLREVETLGPHVASAADDTLLLVGTEDDTPAAWLRTGRALALTLLVLTDAGLASDWSAGIATPSLLRTRFQRELGLLGSPQLMLAVA